MELRSIPQWNEEKERILSGPYEYLCKIQGKDFRATLIRAFNSILKVPDQHIQAIAEVIEMLHTSSLLVDDVEDNAELRRGFPVAHSMFGVAQTINSANYMYFVALQKILELGSQREFIDIYSEEMINLHRGQGMDLYWRETLECPTEAEYLGMVMNKTGGLFRLAVRLMMVLSEHKLPELIDIANILGIIYQIQDDYLNLQSAEYSKNKGFCEDLTEGKFSFPIIHAIRKDPHNKELLNVLRQKTTDITLKEYAVDYMRNTTHSFDHVKTTIDYYDRQARAAIGTVSSKGMDTSKLTAVLDKILSLSGLVRNEQHEQHEQHST